MTGPGRVAVNGNCVAIHMADRYNDPVPLTPAVARAFAARVLAAADSVDHSGVAGEPEATTEEASEIAVADTPIPVHPDTAPDSAAAVLAGAATVSAETVEVFKAAIPEERHGWLPYDEEIRAGLAAALRTAAVDALRAAAHAIRDHCKDWASGHLLDAFATGLDAAAVIVVECADELERGTDRVAD